MWDRERICYYNGEYRPLDQTHIHPQDLGLTRGYGVFDFLQTRRGKPFRIKDHFERFAQSAFLLHLDFNVTFPEFEGIVRELAGRHNLKEYTIRCLLTGGVSPDAIQIGTPNFLVILEQELVYPPKLYTDGAHVVTLQHRRELPEAKTFNYIPSIRLRNELRGRNITEVLYVDHGEVLEASTSNVFLFLGDALVTPRDGVLPGITRKVILEAAIGTFHVEERHVALGELKAADEVFICSTSKGIIPVTRIDDWNVGSGKVGARTRRMMKVFEEFAAEHG